MEKLSIFIDESGDFGEIKERPAYYLVTFVFHDQNKNIDKQVLKLEECGDCRFFNPILKCRIQESPAAEIQVAAGS